MKKTLLISDDFPPKIGGVANYYARMCERLPPDKITVLTVPAASGEAFDRRQRYRIIRQPLLSRNPLVWPKWLTALRRVAQLVRDQQIEMIFVGQILPYGTVAGITHRFKNIPYVVAVHGMDIAIPRGRKRRIAQWVLRQAEWVIANSHATADAAKALGVPPTKVVVVTPAVGVPLRGREPILQNLRQRYGLAQKTVLLTVARLVARKGHRQVIAALPRILAQFPNCVYAVIGEGPELEPLRQFARLQHCQDHVVFTGAVTDEEVEAWYELCDIFVMLSRQDRAGDVEGFGTTYLEAASHGKPAIGSKLPGISEAIVHGLTGLLVPPDAVDELVSAVTSMLAQPGYAHRLGMQAHDRVVRDFTWESRARQIAALLN